MKNNAIGLFWQDEPKTKTECIPPDPVWLETDYLPHLEEARTAEYDIFTQDELEQCAIEVDIAGKKHVLIYDIECYINYFLVAFKSPTLGKIIYVEIIEDKIGIVSIDTLKWIINNFCIVGFNSKSYDDLMVILCVHGLINEQLKVESDNIIQHDHRCKDIMKRHRIDVKEVTHLDSIDVREVAPGSGSLKTYGGRLHTRIMQDLPFTPDTVLSHDQITIIRWYCINDLVVTIELFESLKGPLTLRVGMSKEHRLDLRSKSDPQAAETVICNTIKNMTGVWPHHSNILPGHTFKYKVPKFINFKTPPLKWILSQFKQSNFVISETGAIETPPQLKNLTIEIGSSVYQLGKGGIHSTEESISHIANDDEILAEKDVNAYYSNIIINQQLTPPNMGEDFIHIYKGFLDDRSVHKLEMQRIEKEIDVLLSNDDNTELKKSYAHHEMMSNSKKLSLNGSFGKLNSKWSKLYSPETLIQVTITGQLCLLMLIERLEQAGISVVSANTDGLVIKTPESNRDKLEVICSQWEKETKFNLEETRYSSLYMSNVNNYVGIKSNGDVKRKGWYSEPGLSKNPTNSICVTAVIEYLTNQTAIETTVMQCGDITQFITVRAVKGGGVKVWDESNTEYLGKAIRWYYALNVTGDIVRAKTGGKVAKTDGARPLMTLPDYNKVPDDLDFAWYINESKNILRDIGM